MSTVHLSGLHNNTAAGYGNTARGGSCLSIKGGRHNVALGYKAGAASHDAGNSDTAGYAGLGTTSPTCRLHIDSGRIRFDEMAAPEGRASADGIYRCSYCGTRQERRDDGLLTCRQCGGELELTR